MKISEIVLGGNKKRLHRDPRKRRHIRNDNLYTANPKDLSEGEVKQSFALKVLTNIAARRDNSPFPVKFYDGSVLKVNPVTAKRFLSYYDESDAEKQHWILNYLKTKKGFLELMQPEFIESIEENIDEVIRKVGDKFRLYSKKGKNLGTYDSRAGAEKREKQVNYFKHMSEGYRIQLERDPNMYVLHIVDTATGKRTEVRGKSDYETTGYDANDKLHQLLDKIGKSANISELINGEVVTINPKHPDAEKAKAATDVAFNEAKEIEFVCVNPKFCDATDPKNQEALFQSLKQVPGIIVYRQDFQVHNSMAAILKSSADRNTVKQIKQLAKKHNVGIDLENNVSDRFIDSLYTDSAPNIIDWYDSDHINEGTVKEETGVEMLKIFRNMHHDTARNKEMDAFIKAHEWELRDFTPDMFPSEEEFFDYDDPFDRIIDIDYNHRVDLSQPIIVGPQYSDGKYSVIDGNHRAARAQQLGKTIKGYFPVKATTEGVAREPDPEGYRKTALTAPANTLVIDTKSDLDWYKLGQYISNLNTDDPHEFGQSDSDMVITAANAEQLNKLKRYLDKAGAAYKEISGTHDQPELHTENKRGR
jgi:hypothetical protein